MPEDQVPHLANLAGLGLVATRLECEDLGDSRPGENGVTPANPFEEPHVHEDGPQVVEAEGRIASTVKQLLDSPFASHHPPQRPSQPSNGCSLSRDFHRRLGQRKPRRTSAGGALLDCRAEALVLELGLVDGRGKRFVPRIGDHVPGVVRPVQHPRSLAQAADGDRSWNDEPAARGVLAHGLLSLPRIDCAPSHDRVSVQEPRRSAHGDAAPDPESIAAEFSPTAARWNLPSSSAYFSVSVRRGSTRSLEIPWNARAQSSIVPA